jgi:hypothetical protein
MSDFNIDFSKLGALENGDMVPTGKDSEYSAEFHMAKVPNFEATDFAEVVHLKLQAPGNTKTVYDQPVRMESTPSRPSDPERFPRQWAAFQRGESGIKGTLLAEWSEVTPSDARRMEILGIHTVEQLAQVADSNLDGLGMGGRIVRDRAKSFIEGRGGATPREAALAEQVDKLTDIVNALLAERTEPAAAPAKAKTKEPVNAE